MVHVPIIQYTLEGFFLFKPHNESFIESVQSVISSNNDSIFIICGDFNLPAISWSNDELGLSYTSPSSHCIPESFAFFIFFQLNHISNHIGKLLDLFFSNNNTIFIDKSSTAAVPCNPLAISPSAGYICSTI